MAEIALPLLGVVIGGVITMLTTIMVENLRKPHLEIGMAAPTDREYQDRPAKHARFVHVAVRNKPLPSWARWMSRNVAIHGGATITFHHLDGQNVFGRAMQGRWSSSPEPVPLSLFVEGKTEGFLVDPSRLTLVSRMEIPVGEAEILNVAGRFDQENECYGWSNESYFSNPQWRNPNWRLLGGRYLVKVTVASAGEKCTGIFRLINDAPQNAFRLEPGSQVDVTAIP